MKQTVCPNCRTSLSLPHDMPRVMCSVCGTNFAPARKGAGFSGIAIYVVAGLVVGLVILVLAGATIGGVAMLAMSNTSEEVADESQDSGIALFPNVFSGSTETASNPTDSGGFNEPIPFSQQPKFSQAYGSMHYAWSQGVSKRYRFTYEADVGNDTSILEGGVTYTASGADPLSVMDADELESLKGSATGTGFVVRPDGYIATCAHVVQGSNHMQVELNGNSYIAKVVAIDSQHDLALLRINEKDLSYLPLADSNQVRLAEEVRAFGFPMTDVLGESLKITRGSVAGVIEKDGKKQFQFDATVNPGNSGGPIVNDKGEVFGVATSIMVGEDISAMSFAVVANDLRKLLDVNNLNYQLPDPNATSLSGPDLADQVGKSIALIKVTLGTDGVGVAEKKLVNFSANWRPYRKQKNSSRRTPDGSSVTDTGSVLVDSVGDIGHCSGKRSMPSFLGPVALMCFEKLPDDDSVRKWDSTKLRMIPQTKTTSVLVQPSPYDRLRDPYMRRYRPSAPRVQTRSSLSLHPAIEQTNYRILSESDDVVRVSKDYELTTVDDEGSLPYAKVVGSGTMNFDKVKHLPISMNFRGKLTITIDGASTTIDFRLNYDLDEGTNDSVASNDKPRTDQWPEQPSVTPPSRPSTPNRVPSTPPPSSSGPTTRPDPPVVITPRPKPGYRGAKSNAPVSENGLTLLDLSSP